MFTANSKLTTVYASLGFWFYSGSCIYQHVSSMFISQRTQNWDLSSVFQSPFGFASLNNLLWFTVTSLFSFVQSTYDYVEQHISLLWSTTTLSAVWGVTSFRGIVPCREIFGHRNLQKLFCNEHLWKEFFSLYWGAVLFQLSFPTPITSQP